MNASDRESGRLDRAYVIRYTILFLVMSALVFFPFIRSGTSLVKRIDGLSQYFVYLRYTGQYFRSVLKQILSGSFSFPTYDFSIGMGDDIGQIVRFHPFDFLSVFVPERYTEVLYEFITLLRFYTAGLFFSAFAFFAGRKAARINVLSGSMVYVFCGFMMIRALNHPTYAAPLIVFPMLLLGVEKILRDRAYCLFIAAVFLGFWSNYYFMYIMAAALPVYVLIRFPEVFPTDRVRCFFRLLSGMIPAFLLGTAMSMGTLCPTILRYLSSSRLPKKMTLANLLVYSDKRRYFGWFLNLISPFQGSGNGTNLNFSVIVFPCLAVLFALSRKKYRSLKWCLMGCLVILLLPGAGYLLAFFNEENSRWIFLMVMCVAMAVVVSADLFADLTRRQLLFVVVSSGIFFAGVLVQTILDGANPYNITAALELAVCLAILLWPPLKRRGIRTVRRCVLLITCSSILVNACLTYEPGFGAVVKQYTKAGRPYASFEEYYRSRGAELIKDSSFYRVAGANEKHTWENSAAFFGYNSIEEYNSILNAHLIDALASQNNLGLRAITTVHGMDTRPVAMMLAHARYLVTESPDESSIPYGYVRDPAGDGADVGIYRCENPLSFGYSTGCFITRDSYDALSPLEREMVQLEAVVVDKTEGGEDPARILKEAGLKEVFGPSVSMEEENLILPSSSDGLTFRDGTIRAGKRSAMHFTWKERKGQDAYLLLKSLTASRKISNLRLTSRGHTSVINARSSDQLYNIGRSDYLLHLGYGTSDTEQSAELVFQRAGTYRLEGAQVLYVPMDHFEEKIAQLNAQPLDRERIEDSSVSGEVSFDSARILVLSVPWSDGWKLIVDGEEVKGDGLPEKGILPLKSNIMYQGMLLPEGNHTVSLTYHTPGLAAGCAVCLPAMLLFLVLFYLERRRMRRDKNA